MPEFIDFRVIYSQRTVNDKQSKNKPSLLEQNNQSLLLVGLFLSTMAKATCDSRL